MFLFSSESEVPTGNLSTMFFRRNMGYIYDSMKGVSSSRLPWSMNDDMKWFPRETCEHVVHASCDKFRTSGLPVINNVRYSDDDFVNVIYGVSVQPSLHFSFRPPPSHPPRTHGIGVDQKYIDEVHLVNDR